MMTHRELLDGALATMKDAGARAKERFRRYWYAAIALCVLCAAVIVLHYAAGVSLTWIVVPAFILLDWTLLSPYREACKRWEREQGRVDGIMAAMVCVREVPIDSKTGRRGSWMQTIRGTKIFPYDPRREEINIEDIAYALAREPRFAGHTKGPVYTVAQHCVLASENVEIPDGLRGTDAENAVRLGALLHDASEAFFKDLPHPIKKHLPEYSIAEVRFCNAVAEKYLGSCAWIHLPEVKAVDLRLLPTERRDVMAPRPDEWEVDANEKIKPLPSRIVPWTEEDARSAFLNRFRALRAPFAKGAA